MKIAGRRTYMMAIESITMTDIVLNMFLFFFISFSLLYTFSPDRLHKLGINMPKAKHAKPADNTKQVNISIAKNGVIYLEKEAVTMDELVDGIEIMKSKNSAVRVLLRADQAAPFKDVAKVLDAVNGLEVQSINIGVEAEK